MKPMGGAGIKLTTGEVIGRWSLDDHDGQREEGATGAEDPVARRLPAAQPSSQDGGSSEPAADAFADRMMENLIYKRMKLQAKLGAGKQQPGGTAGKVKTPKAAMSQPADQAATSSAQSEKAPGNHVSRPLERESEQRTEAIRHGGDDERSRNHERRDHRHHRERDHDGERDRDRRDRDRRSYSRDRDRRDRSLTGSDP